MGSDSLSLAFFLASMDAAATAPTMVATKSCISLLKLSLICVTFN